MSKPVSVDLKTLRAAWVRLQGLGRPGKCKAWLHAIGGVDVFLASRARMKGALRKEIQGQCDAAAAFLSEEFGHALIYPMENAKSRASRLASVRGLGA